MGRVWKEMSYTDMKQPVTVPGFQEDFEDIGSGWESGDTVMTGINPAGEMVIKLNLSTSMPWFFGYDLAGNLIEQGAPMNSEGGGEPVIDHIYLGNRILASVTGSGEAGCFVATAAFGSPLATELDTFRAFRDRVLNRVSPGRNFVAFYYGGFGKDAAAWLRGHDTARGVTRFLLVESLVPIKGWLWSPWLCGVVVVCGGATFLSLILTGRLRRRAKLIILSSGLALLILLLYIAAMIPMQASAQSSGYTEGEIYYYMVDHIGRPFALRDDGRDLRWYENHYPFGETITEDTPGGDMYAGAGSYITSWTPAFQFPGQYGEADQFPFVQNHYREYMPEYGNYSRPDPYFTSPKRYLNYQYSLNNPLSFIDPFGLFFTELLPFAGVAPIADGPLPIGDIIALGILSGALAELVVDNYYPPNTMAPTRDRSTPTTVSPPAERVRPRLFGCTFDKRYETCKSSYCVYLCLDSNGNTVPLMVTCPKNTPCPLIPPAMWPH